MLRRLYIDNWRCFVNFEMPFDSIQCVSGSNGVGKSSVMDILQAIKSFVTRGAPINSILPVETITRWSTSAVQQFEIDVQRDGSRYRYVLAVEHDPVRRVARVKKETLQLDGGNLFDFEMGQVQLYRDNFTQGPTFKFDWTLSGLGTVGVGQDNQNLEWFRKWLNRLMIVRINPFLISPEADVENDLLAPDCSNFSSWYRHLALDQPELIARLTERLKTVWPTFRALRLEKAGERVRLLKALISPPSDNRGYLVSELSDGQRCLLVLHTLLALAESSGMGFLALDEPVNFITLPEIQPWLGDLIEAAEDGQLQILLTGHHPEMLDYVGAQRIRMLSRTETGAAQLRTFPTDDEAGLKPSEVIGRSLETADA